MKELIINEGLKLDIEDFQVIKNASMFFPTGSITLVVGASGNGKSSIIRSIKALLLNSSGAQKFIRHGTDSTSVSLDYKGNNVLWKRTKTGSTYSIDGGKPLSKLGTSNITKILDNSGFVIDDKNDVLNIEGAWRVLFPYDKSDTELFKLFENIFCVSDSGKIFQTFKLEEDRLSKELQEYINNLNKNKTKIEAIDNLQRSVNLDRLRGYKNTLAELYESHDNLNIDIVSLKSITKVLEAIPKDMQIVQYDLDYLNRYEKIAKDYSNIKQLSKYLDVTKSISFKATTYDLDYLLKYEKLTKDIKILKQVDKLPLIEDKDIKQYDINLLSKSIKLEADIKVIKQVDRLNEVKIPAIKVFDNELEVCYNKINRDIKALRTLSSDIKKLKEDKEAVEAEIVELDKELAFYDKCEMCGQLIGAGV